MKAKGENSTLPFHPSTSTFNFHPLYDPMATKRPTEKNTKAEILTAFNDLLKEKKALEAQLAQGGNGTVSHQNGNGKFANGAKSSPIAQQQMKHILVRTKSAATQLRWCS